MHRILFVLYFLGYWNPPTVILINFLLMFIGRIPKKIMFCFGKKVLSHLSEEHQLMLMVPLSIIYFVHKNASFPELKTIYSHSGKCKPPKLKQVKEIIIII